MNTGTYVNSVFLQLNPILRDIQAETVRLLASGKAKHFIGSADAAYFRKLENWRIRLDECKTQISQRLSRVEGQRGIPTRGMPADAKYRQNQSLNDQEKQIQAALQLVNEVNRKVAFLFQLSINPTAADRDDDIGKLFDDSLDFAHKLQKINHALEKAQHTGSIDQLCGLRLKSASMAAETRYLQAPHTTPMADPLDILALLLFLLRILWLERSRNANAKE